MERDSRHQCIIYGGSPSQKLPVVASIIQRKLDEGYRCLYLNSAPMVAGLRSVLAAMDIDVVSEIATTRLVLSSAPVSPDGNFDMDKMLDSLSSALDQALLDGYKGLWASGDMTWQFGPRRDFSRLLEYEMRLEELFGRRKELCGICQYHQDTLPHDVLRQSLLAHPSIAVNETLNKVNPHYLRSSTSLDIDIELDNLIDELSK